MSSTTNEKSVHTPLKGPYTMTRYILDSQRKQSNASGEYTVLLQGIQTACKVISDAVRCAGMTNMFGEIDGEEVNATGDHQKKLDVYSNDVMISALRDTGSCCMIVSEENEEPVVMPEEYRGNYVVVTDPLDGSSNIDCNVSVGTIFGIYHRKSSSEEEPTVDDALQPAKNLVGAGYCMYGSSTLLVFSNGNNEVMGFTLDNSVGEFVLTHRNLTIPSGGEIYSCNEGNFAKWSSGIQGFINEVKESGWKARYVGSMIADVNRTYIKGGMFMYPADKKNKRGKLRLVYEVGPLGWLTVQAGGAASDGSQCVTGLVPSGPHERVPVILGDAEYVAMVEKHLANEDKEE